MLPVGIDRAEDAHRVALGRPGEGVVEILSVPHSPEGVSRLIGRIGGLEPDPAEVRVGIQTRHGHLVEAPLDAGYAVVPVKPGLVAHRRGPARKEDHSEDARILCLLALDRHQPFRPLVVPRREQAADLRAIARDDERAARDERRLLSRLRADLMAVNPAALRFAGEDLGAPILLKLLERWPTQRALAAAGEDELLAVLPEAGWDAEGERLPGGEVYRRLPGLGARLAAAEIGDSPWQFETPNSLARYAGEAPVTRHSGKGELVVACRLACNHHLSNAVQQWAFCSLRASGWARAFHDAKRARGKGGHAALRALGNRWLEILWHYLCKGERYDEMTRLANGERALGRSAARGS
jgi:transposase